ncbi:nucleotidyltransferase family protein [Methylocella silvestris]|uniref:nucleotidyltransferase family protein n=1 Tax=Methylocella silvestris TaxID=199596 RepID=UPI001FDF27D7|nr:nucleotidyltransferase family protein [Methylocella silvestris]
MIEVAAIILAAGRSRRFSQNDQVETKLVARLHGRPLVRRVAEAALASRARPVIVVTGHQSEAVEAALQGLPLMFAHNPAYATGLASSLKQGLAAVPASAAGALILLGDMPLVSAALIDRLIGAFEVRSGASLKPPLAAVPLRDGARGNPALIGRELFPALSLLEGDRGARALIEAAGDRLIECPVEDDFSLIDIDTRDALERVAARI